MAVDLYDRSLIYTNARTDGGPTCQEMAVSMAVESRLKKARRLEMRQKWRMPLEAITLSRLRPSPRCVQ